MVNYIFRAENKANDAKTGGEEAHGKKCWNKKNN